MGITKFALLACAGIAGLMQPPDSLAAQQATSSGVGDTSIFAPLVLPTPNEFRSSSGTPGPKYWQNRASYSLSASLDTAAKTLRGAMLMKYTNNSPDTLHFIWLHMEQNAFKPNSLNSYVFPSASRFGARDFDGGDNIERMNQVLGGKRVPLKMHNNGTLARIDLAKPLAPGQTVTIDAAWSFLIPEHGADRMGRDGALYEIAQWFPKVVVYDDIRGWNVDPYLGQAEFYLDYGDYSLEVTVPAGYIVAATGMLTNAKEVLPREQQRRLAQAIKSDSVIRIVTAAELANGSARPKQTGTLTWKFVAYNVRDVAWAASPNYQWDGCGWRGVLAQAFYRPESANVWNDAADQNRASISEYSDRWFRYPYPQVTSVEGPVYGMEYPMLAMQVGGKDKYELYDVLTHEVGHNWFPMVVGSNERLYAWMDEGFNTFINMFAESQRYPEKGTFAQRALKQRSIIEQYQQKNFDSPIDIPPDRIDPKRLAVAGYYKPAAGLQILRDEILGPDVFDDAFKTYINRWAYKHPAPADFYRTMENAAGRRLDWFWRGWFIENPSFDQTVDSVKSATNSDGVTYVGVWYGNKGRGVLPILARFTFSDGTTQDYNYPGEVWSVNTSQYARSYAFQNKTVTRVQLDPDSRLVDKNRANNTWNAPAK